LKRIEEAELLNENLRLKSAKLESIFKAHYGFPFQNFQEVERKIKNHDRTARHEEISILSEISRIENSVHRHHMSAKSTRKEIFSFNQKTALMMTPRKHSVDTIEEESKLKQEIQKEEKKLFILKQARQST